MKNKPMKLSTSSGFGLISVLVVIVIVVVVAILLRSDDPINLIDTNIAPTREGNKLLVTLQDDREVTLPIRGTAIEQPPSQDECENSVYKDIGSLTFVERELADRTFSSSAEENVERVNLRAEIMGKREELKEELKDKFDSGEISTFKKRIDCNLELQPDDLIYMPLYFLGPESSNVTVECLLGEGDARAQIRNPLTTEEQNKSFPMLFFKPANCGIETLSEGGSSFVDELGAVKSLCDPVRNVKINNCRIRGRIEAESLAGDLFGLSTVRSDHVGRLRQSAAQHVTFSNIQIAGRKKGPVHFRPGVHHFTIKDSEILGGFQSVTIHLPADGGWNVIKNNIITGQRKTGGWPWSNSGKKREVISIDSSEHNRIVNNHISDMPYGGIHLYRNCGEKGQIRHRIPQYNQIINNVFDHSVGGQNKPTIFVGSRDDRSIKWNFGWGVKRYCHNDEGKNHKRFPGNDSPAPWDTETVRNSSESNSDWAQNNVIADNQLIKFNNLAKFQGINLSSKAKNLDNYLIGNETASSRSLEDALDIKEMRGAGCAVLAGITNEMEEPYVKIKNGNVPYIRNTESVKYFWDIRPPPVQLACGTPLVCQNNILQRNKEITCEEPIIHDFGSEAQACNAEYNVCAEGSNDGDSHTLDCPGGNLIGIQAACNLEFGKATDAQREQVLLNRVKVVMVSDHKDVGRCTADGTKIKDGQRLISPWLFKRYDDEIIPNEIKYSCKEHDSNGGDCHVNVRHYCEPFRPTGTIID